MKKENSSEGIAKVRTTFLTMINTHPFFCVLVNVSVSIFDKIILNSFKLYIYLDKLHIL